MGTPDHDETSSTITSSINAGATDAKANDHQEIAPDLDVPDIRSALLEFEKSQDPSALKQADGNLVRLAIQKGDQKTLELIYQLHQTEPADTIPAKLWLVAREVEKQLGGQLLGTMVGYANLELIQWIFETLPTERTVATSDIQDELSQDTVSVELFEWLNAHFPALLNSTVVESTAKCVRLAILQWLLHPRRDCFMNVMVFDAAAAEGHLDVVAFLHEEHLNGYSKAAMDKAAAGSHLEVVKFLHEHRTEGCTTSAMDDAAERGDLAAVTFLDENRTEGCIQDAMHNAAARGDLEIVKFLHANRSEDCKQDTFCASACFFPVCSFYMKTESKAVCSSAVIR